MEGVAFATIGINGHFDITKKEVDVIIDLLNVFYAYTFILAVVIRWRFGPLGHPSPVLVQYLPFSTVR